MPATFASPSMRSPAAATTASIASCFVRSPATVTMSASGSSALKASSFSAAMSLAYNHRDMFNQVIALSGYLHTTAPGMHSAIGIAMADAGGYNAFDMWGAPLSDAWRRNDPFLNIDKMKGLDIQIVSANGVPSYWSDPKALYERLPNDFRGIGLEALSRASTIEFEAAARAQGLQFDVQYSPDGIHSWDLWERDLGWVKPRILNHQNAW